MKKKKKTLGIIIVSVLGAATIFCSAMFTHQYLDAKNSKAAFDDLTNLITEIDEPQKDTEAEAESNLSAEELAAAEAALAREKYEALFAQNNDFIGWIRIDGTNVNYPVVQTPNKPDFYLKHSFDKSYSHYGVPYIDEACMTGISNNLVIYGHHMNDGSMWAMWAESPIGHGTASAAAWSGAPASSAGVRTNAAISTPVPFRSSQAVSTVSNGSGSVGSGRITPWSPRPA